MAVKKLAKKKVAVKTAKRSMSKSTKKTKTPMMMSKKTTSPINKPFTKSEILAEIAGNIGLTRSQVNTMFESLQNLVERHIKRNAAGLFVLPGLLKIQVINKPATKARKGINPFTGEPTVFKAKPARNIVKVKALKKLKAMV